MAIAINGSGTVTGISVGGLPDGIVDTDMLAANAVTAAKTTVAGITEADMWRRNSDFTATQNAFTIITSNWERPDSANDAFNYLGTGMSVDGSGIWTFPSTGYWYVTFGMCWYSNGSSSNENWIYIDATEDNSTYAITSMQSNAGSSGQVYGGNISTIIDCTSTSNVKVRFKVYAGAANQVVVGNSTQSRTYVQFIRLGDT